MGSSTSCCRPISGASQSNLKFTAALPEAVAGADLIQENGPERIDFKQKLYGQLDQLLPPDLGSFAVEPEVHGRAPGSSRRRRPYPGERARADRFQAEALWAARPAAAARSRELRSRT